MLWRSSGMLWKQLFFLLLAGLFMCCTCLKSPVTPFQHGGYRLLVAPGRPISRENESFRSSHAYTQLYSQSSDDFKVNAQIARLNAVAAKLRAEAAELEAEQRKTAAEDLSRAFRDLNFRYKGTVTVEDMMNGLSEVLAQLENDEHAVKIMQLFESIEEETGTTQNRFRTVEEFRRKLDQVLQDEKDCVFVAKRQAVNSKFAAEKAEAVAELINNRSPTSVDRILAGLAYVVPVLDALACTKTSQLDASPAFSLGTALLAAYKAFPLSGLVGFLSLNVLSNNLRLHRLVRFSVQQAVLLDMALIIPALLQLLASATEKVFDFEMGVTSSPLLATASNVLLLGFLGACLYGVGCSLVGVEADYIPFFSYRVKRRVPTSKEFLAMFDVDGNFVPPALDGEQIRKEVRRQ